MGGDEVSGNAGGVAKVLVSTLLALTGVFTLLLYADRRRVVGPSPINFEEDESETAYGAAIKSSKPWTMQRTGYDPLPYFTTTSSSDNRNYAILDGYDGIVEPGVENTLYIKGFSTSKSKYYYSYKICEASGTTCQTGALYPKKSAVGNVGVTFSGVSPYDVLSLTITKKSQTDDSIKGVTTGSLLCMYVRREIRTLSETDLAATMDAMYTIYSMSEEDGQALYGSAFHNSTYYTKVHHFNAAWQDSDHIHEGLGFLPQHMKMSNMFEEGMQAVDASLTLPYWDFTQEKNITGGTPFGSVMFSSETFGSLRLPEDQDFGYTYAANSIADAHIQDGRWKKLKADVMYSTPPGYEELIKNFGYLRAPWNINPSPYVSRFVNYNAALPTCQDHYSWITDSDKLADFLQVAPLAPHAKTHGAVGSVFGCDLMDTMLDAGLITSSGKQVLLCTQWPIVLKIMYRKGYLSGMDKDSCERPSVKKVDSFDCTLQCNDDGSGAFEEYLSSLLIKYTGALSDAQQTEWKDFVCSNGGTRVFAGDHLEAASPADPSFWPIHPALERVLQAKFLSGGFSDSSWPAYDDTKSSTDYICDRTNCYEETEESLWGDFEECCDGHYEDDKLLDFVGGSRFGDLSGAPGLSKHALMGNADAIAGTDPTSADYSMPYIYDHFDWTHCSDDEDEDIESLLTSSAR